MIVGGMMTALAATPDRSDVDAVLDALHAAATAADGEGYFGLFHPDAVFVGTDATEVWPLADFRAFAEPHFEEAPAWVYTPGERRVGFGPKGRTAWFFEELTSEKYGAARGSGALVLSGDQWLVTQYVLSFPVPNASVGARLPTPFTAEQIRASYVPGLRVTTHEVDSDGERWSRTEVVASDAERVTLRFQALDADGVEVGEPAEQQALWTDLRDHAAFPVAGTSWTDEQLTIPLGTFPCRRYDVGEQRFWFSPAHPGQPFRVTGAGGYVMEMIGREGGD